MENLDEKILQRIEKDREKVEKLFDNLSEMLVMAADFSVNGETAVKLADLMTKQTNQLIEIYKIKEKSKLPEKEGLDFSDDEMDELQEEIDKKLKAVK